MSNLHKQDDATREDSAPKNDTSNASKSRARAFFDAAKNYIIFAKVELIIIALSIFLDLLTKYLIDKFMNEYDVNVLIKNFLQLRYVYNENAAFGSAFGLDRLLSENGVRIFFVVFPLLAVSLFCYMMYRFRDRGIFVRVAFALVIGGAIGNLYDRMVYGYVRDFVEIVFFGLDIPLVGSTFAIFNIADAALVVGMIMLLIFFIFKYRPDHDDQEKNCQDNQGNNSDCDEQVNYDLTLEKNYNAENNSCAENNNSDQLRGKSEQGNKDKTQDEG